VTDNTVEVLRAIGAIVELLSRHDFESCNLTKVKTTVAGFSSLRDGPTYESAREVLILANMALSRFFHDQIEGKRTSSEIDPVIFASVVLTFSKLVVKPEFEEEVLRLETEMAPVLA